jgi:hypothetical protein
VFYYQSWPRKKDVQEEEEEDFEEEKKEMEAPVTVNMAGSAIL